MALPNFDIIREQPSVDSFSSVSHETTPSKSSLLQKPWQPSTVIQMKATEGKQ